MKKSIKNKRKLIDMSKMTLEERRQIFKDALLRVKWASPFKKSEPKLAS